MQNAVVPDARGPESREPSYQLLALRFGIEGDPVERPEDRLLHCRSRGAQGTSLAALAPNELLNPLVRQAEEISGVAEPQIELVDKRACGLSRRFVRLLTLLARPATGVSAPAYCFKGTRGQTNVFD